MTVIDEAFLPFQEVLQQMLSFGGDLVDDELGIHTYIYAADIETPVELDVVKDEQGKLHIGSTPPLYPVDTSFRPVFHHLKFCAQRTGSADGD